MRFVSLFAGPGGMCKGAEMAGHQTIGIEWDANACRTRRAAGLPTVEGDVRRFGPQDFPDCTGLMAGPPCQTFTVAGSGSGRKNLDTVKQLIRSMESGEDIAVRLSELGDDRTALVLEPLRWILEADRARSPYEVVILEQVTAVLPVWQEMAQVMRRLGYSVATGLVNAEEFGVPQTRKRAVLVARLDGEVAALPVPTHRKYRKGVSRSDGDQSLKPWVSLGDVADRGIDYWVRSNYNNASTGLRGRRTSDDPAFTVTGAVMRNRFFREDGFELDRVDYSEAGAIQTFPRDYPWSGKYIHQQIGNATPPLLVSALVSAATAPGA